MRKASFIITILGTFLLFSLIFFQKPLHLNSTEELQNFKENQRVIITGSVISQTPSTMKLSNNLYIQCYSCPSYLEKEIIVTAKIEKYNNKTYLKALKIYEK